MDQIEQRDSTLLDEEWRDAVGWEDRYQVSSLGRVRSKDWQVTTGRWKLRLQRISIESNSIS